MSWEWKWAAIWSQQTALFSSRIAHINKSCLFRPHTHTHTRDVRPVAQLIKQTGYMLRLERDSCFMLCSASLAPRLPDKSQGDIDLLCLHMAFASRKQTRYVLGGLSYVSHTRGSLSS